MSQSNKWEDAISRKDHDEVLMLLPSLKHHEIRCDVKQFAILPFWKLPVQAPLLHTCALLGWIDIVQLLIITYNCNPLRKDDDDYHYTALHYAALGGHLDIVQYFIQECNIDPMNRGWNGIVPLHLAAWSGKVFIYFVVSMETKLRTVKYLIEQCHCDPMVRDSNGWTPLHYVARRGDIAIVQYLINDCHCDPMVRDNYGCTPLHDAARGGDIAIVQYLMNDCHCDPMCTTNKGRTPVHYALQENHYHIAAYLNNDHDCHPNKYNHNPLHDAIRYNDLSLFQHLINNEHHDPMCIDGYGCAPLHIACRIGCIPIIQYLLSIPTVDPLARDIYQRTPLMVAAGYGTLDTVAPIFEKFGKVRISHSVGSFVNIFLLGNPKAGKTTLTQVIKDRASNFFKFGAVKQVESSTAGIVPTRLHNTELGNVLLHDFAGQPQYYSSHTAVLENLLLNSGAMFLLLINLTQDVLKQVRFWWSVVLNESTKVSSQCHLIVIGSHVDEVSDHQSSLAILNHFVSKQVTASNINVGGVFTLNCCQRSGNSLKLVLTQLSKLCMSIRSKQRLQMSLSCNFLYSLLDSNTSTQNIYTLPQIQALCEQAQQQQGIPLPEDATPLLTDLHSSGLVVYLHNLTNSWVVIRKEILLAHVDGVLFAPTDFSQHCDIASNTGIVTTTALATLFPDYSLDMLISFLQFMKLCEEIEISLLDATNLQLKEEISSAGKLLFFPALIAEKRPQEIKGHFKIGWCLECGPAQFFSVRFLHVLLLQLAHQYALPGVKGKLERLCSVWINGIHWNDNDGIETLVEQLEDNQCVMVLMSCLSGAKQDMVRLHCELVKKIVSLQQQYCPILHCTEYLIEPSLLHYPFDQPSKMTRYDMEQLMCCASDQRRTVVSSDGLKQQLISMLLIIEPSRYHSLRLNPEQTQVCGYFCYGLIM